MTEQEQTAKEYMSLGEEEETDAEEDNKYSETEEPIAAPMQNGMELPTMDSVMPEIALEDVFDTSLLPSI